MVGPKNEDGNPNTDNNPVQRAHLINNANWAQTAFNGEDVNFNGLLDSGEDTDGNGKITRFILPSPPDVPRTRIEASDGKVDIYWSNNSEASVDPITRIKDFEGYRVYLSKLGFDVTGTPDLARDFVQIASYDSTERTLLRQWIRSDPAARSTSILMGIPWPITTGTQWMVCRMAGSTPWR